MRVSTIIASVALVGSALISGVRGQCDVIAANVDPFTLTEKMGALRPGNLVKITIRIGNPQVFDITGLALDVPTPAGTTYQKSKMSARPDSFNAKNDGKTPKATLTGSTLTWDNFVLPANMTRARTAYVWYRINKPVPAGTTSITFGPAVVRNATAGAAATCKVDSNTDSITIK